MAIVLVKVAGAGVSTRAALRGSNLAPMLDLGLRRLIPSLEHVTFRVPTVTPICAAIISQVSPRAMRSLIC